MGNCCDVPGAEPDRLGLHVASTGAALVSTLAGWLLPVAGLPGLALPALLLAYLAAGWDATIRAARALRAGALDVDVLMLLAAAGAAFVGHWLEGAVLLFLFSLGNTLETFAFRRTRRSIEALVELSPDEALRLDADGAEHTVAVEALRIGDVVRVRPGDRLPVDGTVLAGTSDVDESTLTGEPRPVAKEAGQDVFAGTLNGAGSLDVRMTRSADETALARIIQLVEEAREARAPAQSWIEDVEGRYATGVIVAAGLAVLIPWTVLGWSFDDAMYRAMTLLVVASPCALVISIPATIVSAVANGARHGILFKGGAHIDALSEVRTFAFDKTGTITVGRPEVIGVAGMERDGAVPEDRLLTLAASAERRSEHHLAAAIVRSAEARGVPILEPDEFGSVPGQGVTASIDGRVVRVGKAAWLETSGIAVSDGPERALRADHPTATIVHVAADRDYVGAVAVQDHPRDGAAEAIEALRESGVDRIVMLTGDASETADAVAGEVGIGEVHASLAPDEKGERLLALRRETDVAMVGDGVNDAPALALADVGIAMGAAGTDVALETADIVVMGERLDALAYAVRLSRRTRTVVRQNLVFAVVVMALLVAGALLGLVGLTEGVVGHEGSTILVVLNGLRLLADERT